MTRRPHQRAESDPRADHVGERKRGAREKGIRRRQDVLDVLAVRGRGVRVAFEVRVGCAEVGETAARNREHHALVAIWPTHHHRIAEGQSILSDRQVHAFGQAQDRWRRRIIQAANGISPRADRGEDPLRTYLEAMPAELVVDTRARQPTVCQSQEAFQAGVVGHSRAVASR